MPKAKNPQLTPELYAYLLDHNPPLDQVQRDLIDLTRRQYPDDFVLQATEEQGPLLAFLVRLTGARQVVEVGTFTGFSALSMAQALPSNGHLITCDISEEWAAVARDAWARSGVTERIELRLGPAVETLRSLPDDEPWIDMSFIDADKCNYLRYWEELVRRTRPGGLLVADNTLYHGEVARPSMTGEAASIRAFNERVKNDSRVEAVLLSVADGLTLARRAN
ncbi:MAG: O-methyltransferase [Trebonia sp.]